ncbi:hypothetical protein [Flavihumibacter sp. ZG627]|uniref:hypothetical protein n=1 Tax=Flavihumibacter sp. ZG627 TaxID=1463156 RepID=UPI000B115AC9|nr:hypothetical protein [Flavihumibacter sp. ZG627]
MKRYNMKFPIMGTVWMTMVLVLMQVSLLAQTVSLAENVNDNEKVFRAIKQKDKVMLEWDAFTILRGSHFALERSIDGKSYKTIALVFMAEDPATIPTYGYADRSGVNEGGNVFYRLLVYDRNEKVVRKMECSRDDKMDLHKGMAVTKF